MAIGEGKARFLGVHGGKRTAVSANPDTCHNHAGKAEGIKKLLVPNLQSGNAPLGLFDEDHLPSLHKIPSLKPVEVHSSGKCLSV